MPLFGHKPVPSAHIVPNGTVPLNKDQKTFNSLIKKIEDRRACLREWERALPVFRQKYAADLLPLRQQQRELQWQLARALDDAHDRKETTKGEKRKIAVMITDLAEDLLAHEDRDEIKTLFNKYSQSDFDEQQAERMDGMKTLLEKVLGIDLGDDDMSMASPDDILDRMEIQFQAEQEAEQEKASRRKKSRREEARAAKHEAEEKQLSQSIRDVFRKLASALHPDRESDPAERDRKTALMQRANQAYDEGNLLQLLELQLELEHIDQTQLAAISPERLKHYIKILKGQVHDLDMEIQYVEEQLSFEFGISTFGPILPKDLLPMVQQDIVTCQTQVTKLRQHLENAANPQRLKAWLKILTLRRRAYRPDLGMPF
jgi:hypothetical protein